MKILTTAPSDNLHVYCGKPDGKDTTIWIKYYQKWATEVIRLDFDMADAEAFYEAFGKVLAEDQEKAKLEVVDE